MRHITIKGYWLGSLVEIETYYSLTGWVRGALIPVGELWAWINRARPCFVYRGGRAYKLGRL